MNKYWKETKEKLLELEKDFKQDINLLKISEYEKDHLVLYAQDVRNIINLFEKCMEDDNK